MQNHHDSKFGDLLVQAGTVTQAQLDHALQVQKEQEERQSIGTVLVDLGHLTRRKLRTAVRRFGRRVLVGELLVAEGAITREQLSAALRLQKGTNRSLGSLLVAERVLSEDELARALGKQLDIPYMVPHSGMVDTDVFCRLPEQFIRTNSVLPVCEQDGVVTVVISDPADSGLIMRLERAFGENVELATCSKTKIDEIIDQLMLRRSLVARATTDREADTAARSRVALAIDGKTVLGKKADGRVDNIFDGIVYEALSRGASDIHLEPQRHWLQVRYRIDGVMVSGGEFPLGLAGPFTRRAKVLAEMDPTGIHKAQEGRLFAEVDGREFDLRVSVWPSVLGESVAIHSFSRDMGTMPIEQLGMLPRMLADFDRALATGLGATLFVGPTGAGKTTSFYAALSRLNDSTRKIVTVEAPVELALDGVVQNSLRSYESSDVLDALAGAVRHDPDIVGVGSITSNEIADALIHLCMMGRKVFSTMHAEDAAGALLRLCNLPGAASFLTSCSVLLVGQVLVRRVCQSCAEVYVPHPRLLREFQVKDLDLDTIDFRRGVGCSECMGTGFRGRTAVFEMFEAKPEMQMMLLKKPSVSEIRRTMTESPHFLSVRQAGFLKAVQGVATLEEVAHASPAVREQMLGAEQYTLDELCRRAGLVFEDQEGRIIDDAGEADAHKESRQASGSG